jgi:hypothetical protein
VLNLVRSESFIRIETGIVKYEIGVADEDYSSGRTKYRRMYMSIWTYK